MKYTLPKPKQLPQGTRQMFMSLSCVCIVCLAPFAVSNFLYGQHLLGIGASIIVLTFVINIISIFFRQSYYPASILWGLAPAITFFLTICLRDQGLIGVLWSYPAVISFYFLLKQREAWLFNGLLLLSILPQILIQFETELALRMIATLMTVSIFSAIFIREITNQRMKLREQLVTDPLTGALNRTLLDKTLLDASELAQRTDLPMTLIALDLDLDKFKVINDEYGHSMGDKVLVDVTALVSLRCRSADKLFRVGGEEFLLLLYGTDNDNAQIVAEDIRSSIAKLLTIPGHQFTTSAGIATLAEGETWRAWVKRSDDNLYRAKKSGRNKVIA